MKSKLASEGDGRTFVPILDRGEEAFAAVTAFANEKAIKAAPSSSPFRSLNRP